MDVSVFAIQLRDSVQNVYRNDGFSHRTTISVNNFGPDKILVDNKIVIGAGEGGVVAGVGEGEISNLLLCNDMKQTLSIVMF